MQRGRRAGEPATAAAAEAPPTSVRATVCTVRPADPEGAALEACSMGAGARSAASTPCTRAGCSKGWGGGGW
jgi:hypothetical protein